MSGDSDIEILEELDPLQEWKPLENYMFKNDHFQRKILSHCKNVAGRKDLVRSYVKIWEQCGYSYISLKTKCFKIIRLNDSGRENEFKRSLWEEANKIKEKQRGGSANVSCSQLVDRSYDHFKEISSKTAFDSPEYTPTSNKRQRSGSGGSVSEHGSKSVKRSRSGESDGSRSQQLSWGGFDVTPAGPSAGRSTQPVSSREELDFMTFIGKKLRSKGLGNETEICHAIFNHLKHQNLHIRQVVEFYAVNKLYHEERKENFFSILNVLLSNCTDMTRFGVDSKLVNELIQQHCQMAIIEDESFENKVKSPSGSTARERFEELLSIARQSPRRTQFSPAASSRPSPQIYEQGPHQIGVGSGGYESRAPQYGGVGAGYQSGASHHGDLGAGYHGDMERGYQSNAPGYSTSRSSSRDRFGNGLPDLSTAPPPLPRQGSFERGHGGPDSQGGYGGHGGHGGYGDRPGPSGSGGGYQSVQRTPEYQSPSQSYRGYQTTSGGRAPSTPGSSSAGGTHQYTRTGQGPRTPSTPGSGSYVARGPHTPPTNSPYHNKRERFPSRENSRRFQKVASNRFQFSITKNHFEGQPHHVLSKNRRALPSKSSDYIMVGFDMIIVGDGYLNNTILQLGMSTNEDGNKIFVGQPEEGEVHEDMLRSMGYRDISTRHMWFELDNREKCEIMPHPKNLIRAFIDKLKFTSGKFDRNGVILACLHSEPLVELIKLVILNRLERDFQMVVKGYCILEPTIQNDCLVPHVIDNRITKQIAADIFELNRPPDKYSYPQLSAKNIIDMVYILQKNEILNDSDLFSIDLDKINEFKDHIKNLENMSDVFQHIISELKREEKSTNRKLKLTGLIHPFPRKGSLCRPSEELARVLINALLVRNTTMNQLEGWADLDPTLFEKRMHQSIENVFPELGHRKDLESEQFDSAIRSLIQFVCSQRINRQESDRHRQKSGDSYTSETSMPEDREGSPIKDPDFNKFQVFLTEELHTLGRDKRGLTRLSFCNIATAITKLMINHFQGFTIMKSCFVKNSKEKLVHELVPMLRQIAGSDNPKNLQVYTLSDAVELTHKFFNQKPAMYNDKEYKGLERAMQNYIRDTNKIEPEAIPETAVKIIASLELSGYKYDRILTIFQSHQSKDMFISKIAHSLKRKVGDTISGFDLYDIVTWIHTYLSQSAPAAAPSNSGLQKRLIDAAIEPSSGTPKSAAKKRKKGGGGAGRGGPQNQSCDMSPLFKGVEMEITALNCYAERKKIVKSKAPEAIVEEIADKLEHAQLGFKVVINRLKQAADFEAEKKKFIDKIFKAEDVEHKTLFNRFCEYVKNPQLIKEDEEAPPEPDFIPTIENIQLIIDELKKRTSKFKNETLKVLRHSPNDKEKQIIEKLHEFLMYNQQLLVINMNAKDQTKLTSEKATAVIKHIVKRTTLSRISNKYVEWRELCMSRAQLQKKMMELIQVDKLPECCKTISGLLGSVILDFFEQFSFGKPVSQQVVKVKMKVDETNALVELQEYIFHIYIEAAMDMHSEGEISNFELDYVDIDRLSESVHSTINYIINAGFQLYIAIENFIKGNFCQWLKKLLRPHQKSDPEGDYNALIVRLCLDWLDTKIKCYKPNLLPQAKMHRSKLKQKVALLINHGNFIREEYKENVCVSLSVPRTDLETLAPVPSRSPTPPPDLKPDLDQIGDIKSEYPTTSGVPAYISTTKVVIVPTKSVKTIFGVVNGLPKFKDDPVLNLTASDQIKKLGLIVRDQKCKLGVDNTVLVKLENRSETEVIKIEADFTVAQVKILDASQVVNSDSPGYCLQYVRHYFLSEGVKDINLKGSYFCFGEDPNKSVKMDKDRRTNFKIFGTTYSCGIQDYYTLEAVIYFLNMVEKMDYPYSDYLNLALESGKQVVRERDYATMWRYLHGEINICDSINTDFSEEESRQLNFLFLQARQLDSVVNTGTIMNDIKDEEGRGMKVEEALEEENNKDITKINNPNRTVILLMKDYLSEEWNMSSNQAIYMINLLLQTLENLGMPLSQVRIDYFAVPNHRNVYQDIISSKLTNKLEEDARHKGMDVETSTKSFFKAFNSCTFPKNVRDMKSFLSLADIMRDNLEEVNEYLERLKESVEEKENLGEEMKPDQEHLEAFRKITQTLGKLEGVRPPISEGNLVMYTGFCKEFLVNIVIQCPASESETDTKSEVVGVNIRRMSPREEGLHKDEKDIIAVTWGLQINKEIIYKEKVEVRSSNKTAIQVFTEDDKHSERWRKQVDMFDYTASLIREESNPVYALRHCQWTNLGQVPVDTLCVVESLFCKMLTIIRTTTKNRQRWLKHKMKWERRQMLETIETKGCNPWDNLDTTRETDNSQAENFGPDFIATGTVSGQDNVQLSEEAGQYPEFIEPTYQPLYQLFYEKLMNIQKADRTKVIDVCNKVFTCLCVNGISYSKLKDIMLDLKCIENVTLGQVKDHIKALVDTAAGITSFSHEDLLIQTIVDHFSQILEIRPVIPRSLVRISDKSLAPEQSQKELQVQNMGSIGQEDDNVMDQEDIITAELQSQSVQSDHPDWFLQALMEDDPLMTSSGPSAVQTVARNEARGSADSHVGKTSSESTSADATFDSGAGSLQLLVPYYDLMIKTLKSREQRKLSESRITGEDFKRVWIIAQVDFRTLKSVFELNPRDPSYVKEKYRAHLDPFKSVVVKDIDIDRLVEWTYKYFDHELNKKRLFLQFDEMKERMLTMQLGDQQDKEFVDLKAFFQLVMTQKHGMKEAQEKSYAKKYIQAIKLLGFKEDDWREICHAATSISTSTQQFTSRLSEMLSGVGTLISDDVDTNILIRTCLAFYRVEVKVDELAREQCDHLSTPHQRKDSLNIITKCVVEKLKEDFSTVLTSQIGTLVMNERVQIPPEETKEVTVKIKMMNTSFIPDGSPIKIVQNRHPSTGFPKDIVLEDQSLKYSGGLDEILVQLTNTDEEKSANVGHPTKSIEIGKVIIDGCGQSEVEKNCDQFEDILVKLGYNLDNFMNLSYNIVQEGKGMMRNVCVTALVAGLCNAARKQNEKLNIYLFQLFVKYFIYACLNTTRDELKVKQERREPSPQEEGEEGEIQEDKTTFSKAKCKTPQFEMTRMADVPEFPGTNIDLDELKSASVKQVELVDIWQIISNNYPSINLNYLIDGKVLAGKYLLDPDEMLEMLVDDDVISYSIRTIILFLRFKKFSHTIYVKKATTQFPDQDVVKMDDRKKVLSFIDSPSSMEEEVELLTRESYLRRLYSRYEDLTSEPDPVESVPSSQALPDFHKLFAKYFTKIYPTGFKCQVNWLEVVCFLSEQLIHTWAITGYTVDHLILKQRKAHHEKSETKKRERLKRLVKSYNRRLRSEVWCTRLPKGMLENIIRETIHCVNSLLESEDYWHQQLDNQRRLDAVEISSDSEDEEITAPSSRHEVSAGRDDLSKLPTEVTSPEAATVEDDPVSEEDENQSLVNMLKEKNAQMDLDEMDPNALMEKEYELKRRLEEESPEMQDAHDDGAQDMHDSHDQETMETEDAHEKEGEDENSGSRCVSPEYVITSEEEDDE